MSTLRSIETRLAVAEKRLQGEREQLLRQKTALIRRKFIRCNNHTCGKKSAFYHWAFVQNCWYEGPHGDMGGATWHHTKTECCHIVCPNCQAMNYICNHPQKVMLVDIIDDRQIDRSMIFAELWEKYGNDPPKKIFPITK